MVYHTCGDPAGRADDHLALVVSGVNLLDLRDLQCISTAGVVVSDGVPVVRYGQG